jgi:peroxiredoxin
VAIPPTPLLANGQTDSLFAYRYLKSHYFDDFDLSDERLLRTGLFESKIKNYIEKLTYQVEDSLNKSIDLMMKLAGNTAPNRKFIASKMTALYENSNTIGVDGAFVHTVEKYYEAEPNLWNADALRQMIKRAKTLKPLLVNRVIPNLQVSNLSGQMMDLHSLQAKYTVLYFYSLTCKHCQEHAPKMAVFQRKMSQKGVKVFAVAVERNDSQWRNFIKTYHTENLINGIDLKNQIDFTNQYNTIEFPTVFVLDESKKIIGKKINPAMLEQFIAYYEKH